MKPEELFKGWKESLKSPDDSIFYYHTELERILLGLAIFALSSEPIFRKIGKDDSLSLLNVYITDLITAWIDEDDEAFEQMLLPKSRSSAQKYSNLCKPMATSFFPS